MTLNLKEVVSGARQRLGLRQSSAAFPGRIHGNPQDGLQAGHRSAVAQVANLLYRRLLVGRACEGPNVCALAIRNTEDW